MTTDQRRHKRIKLNVIEINGKMSLADKVELIDISLGGVALKADRRLNIGKEYSVKLGEQGSIIEVKGVVVRSSLSSIEEKINGERVSIYTAGLKFLEGASDKITNFLGSMACMHKVAVPVTSDRRSAIRFQIVIPGEKVLNFPSQFRVREISLCGILIRSQQSLAIDHIIPMELSLNADSMVKFNGRVAYCRTIVQGELTNYDIGVEFNDLSVDDKSLLSQFIDYLVVQEVHVNGHKADA